jgi:hypothetical protein
MVKKYGHLKILAQMSLLCFAFVVIARASRPNKQREAKSNIHLAFS